MLVLWIIGPVVAVQCGTVTVLYCVTLYVGAVDNWACYGSAVWHSHSAVLCDIVYIGIWCLSLLRTAMLCLGKEETNKLSYGECWQTAVVLIHNYGKSSRLARKLLIINSLMLSASVAVWGVEFIFRYNNGSVVIT